MENIQNAHACDGKKDVWDKRKDILDQKPVVMQWKRGKYIDGLSEILAGDKQQLSTTPPASGVR